MISPQPPAKNHQRPPPKGLRCHKCARALRFHKDPYTVVMGHIYAYQHPCPLAVYPKNGLGGWTFCMLCTVTMTEVEKLEIARINIEIDSTADDGTVPEWVR